MSTRKIVSLGAVVLLHVALGYAFISGLAMDVVKNVSKDLNVFDVAEEPPPPPDEPPPPPPETPKTVEPPPVVTPPPIVRTAAPPVVQIQAVPKAPPVIYAPAAPTIAPPAPPAPPVISKAAGAKGNPGSWVTTDDYPPAAIRDGVSGKSTLTFDIDAAGRVQNCRVSASSGSSLLDDTACRLVTRRGRYTPALDQSGNPTPGGSKTLTFTWRLPE